ncbi:MAG: DUF4276 family protein [Armatimonadetes bacterium]|nr:DUF4276 family protein [Armatimonadota bacterium]
MRTGFKKLIDRALPVTLPVTVVPCGSRNAAFDRFCTALREQPHRRNVLLVDSEEPVVGSRWAHLQSRDGWVNREVSEGQCHLMVVVMETWLLTDPDALADFYQLGFNRNPLPGHPILEGLVKQTVYGALEDATRECRKGSYQKIDHGPLLLAMLDPAIVRQRAPAFGAFIDAVQGVE